MNLAWHFSDTGFLAEKRYNGELMIIAKLFPLAGWSVFDESDNSTISDTYASDNAQQRLRPAKLT
jgi:hypothetical protein